MVFLSRLLALLVVETRKRLVLLGSGNGDAQVEEVVLRLDVREGTHKWRRFLRLD
jgi:hypothetical protein